MTTVIPPDMLDWMKDNLSDEFVESELEKLRREQGVGRGEYGIPLPAPSPMPYNPRREEEEPSRIEVDISGGDIYDGYRL